MRHHVMLSGVACLLAGAAVLYASSGFGLSSLDWRIAGLKFAEARSVQPDALPASLCIAGTDAPALRAWISEHPKSPRGRLDHQRLRLQAAE